MCATTATLGYCVMLVIDVIHKASYLSRIAASFPHLNALVVPSSTIETSFQGRSIKVSSRHLWALFPEVCSFISNRNLNTHTLVITMGSNNRLYILVASQTALTNNSNEGFS